VAVLLPRGRSPHVSGEIPRVTSFEQGFPEQHRRTLDGQEWEPDSLTADERYVAVNIAGKGLVVLMACSHAGVINVLTHAKERFAGIAIHAVVGRHSSCGCQKKSFRRQLMPRARSLRRSSRPAIAPDGAMSALATAFGDKCLAPLAVGKRYTF
jgi:7,8-dihydropterin-6-yl-methyl-4-(beta-D-ribofuranosyl)aminobenzene 5'-phosphate synthase